MSTRASRESPLSADELDLLWTQITTGSTRVLHRTEAAQIEDAGIRQRFMSYSDIEDLLVAYGIRWPTHELPLERIATHLGIHPVTSFFRPSTERGSTMGFEALRLEDAARLLITLERMGLSVAPGALVRAVAAPVAKAARLTAAELDAYWYEGLRLKWPPLLLDGAPERMVRACTREKHRSETGFRAEAWRDREGAIVRIQVRAPRYRAPGPTQEVVCEECGVRYTRGERESSAAHRSEHKKRMHVLNPHPSARLLEARAAEPEPSIVRMASPAWKHREMYERARAFKREFQYDFVQWGSRRADNDPHVQGILFDLPDGRIVGACAFRWREYEELPAPFWGLQWVWIAPGFRRQGVLSSRWTMLRERFGDFLVEPPVSDAMQTFLNRKNDTSLMTPPV